MAERGNRGVQPDQGANFVPSPEQIEAAAAEIRAGWSKAENAKRAGIDFSAWYVPVVSAADLLPAAGRRDG
jgi:hypothetical protein